MTGSDAFRQKVNKCVSAIGVESLIRHGLQLCRVRRNGRSDSEMRLMIINSSLITYHYFLDWFACLCLCVWNFSLLHGLICFELLLLILLLVLKQLTINYLCRWPQQSV